jgi:hypothetical protein
MRPIERAVPGAGVRSSHDQRSLMYIGLGTLILIIILVIILL